MSTSAITVSAWTRQQQRAARWLALGLSQSEAARREGVPLRTMQRWCSEDGLETLADELHTRGWERVDPLLWRNLELALELQVEVFAGDRAADDARYLEARRFLDVALGYRSTQRANSRPPAPLDYLNAIDDD